MTTLRSVRDGDVRPAPPTLRGTCDSHPRYTAGCRACQQRSAARRRTRYRAAAYGLLTPGRVNAAQARERITDLHDNHRMSYRHIAYAAGVRRDAVTRIAAGTQQWAAARTIDGILRVHPTGGVDEVLVRRTLNGLAPFVDLSDAGRVALWPLWRRRRKGEGGEHGADGFAKEYGITRNEARRIEYAATQAAPTRSRKPVAAGSRTNRKVA